MAILSAFILLLCLSVPNFAPALNFSRFYQVTMLFLAPMFSLGGMYFVRLVRKSASPFLHWFDKVSRRDLELHIVTAVLIGFFLFQVGFVNHVTGGYPYSYSLDFGRKQASNDLGMTIDFHTVYVTEQEVLSARWLAKYMDKTQMTYADSIPYYHTLHAYALLPFTQVGDLSKNMTFPRNSYVYLGYLNIQHDVILPRGSTGYLGMPFNLSEIDFLKNNKIYSNGHSDVYYSP